MLKEDTLNHTYVNVNDDSLMQDFFSLWSDSLSLGVIYSKDSKDAGNLTTVKFVIELYNIPSELHDNLTCHF